MLETIKLPPRLKAAADMLGRSGCAADIGTDHGYIPVYLAQNGLCCRVIASDVKSAPLDSARRNADRFGVADRIEFMLTDGMSGMKGRHIDGAIMAGMGGETIEAILGAAPWVRVQGVRLVLQPQTKLGELSNWLDNNGYAIVDDTLVKEAGRIYTVLLAQAGPSRAPLSCAEIYADRLLLEKRDPLLPEYLDGLISRFKRALDGMESASRRVRADERMHTRLALEGFLAMREETRKW